MEQVTRETAEAVARFAAPAEPSRRNCSPGRRATSGIWDICSTFACRSIRLGSTRMALEDVLRLAPGAVVELDRNEGEPLEVLANGRVIARGEVVVVEERFGLRLTEIGSTEDRILATT